MSLEQDVLTALEREAPGLVQTDASLIAEHSTDRSGHAAPAPPLGVVHPKDTAQVQAVCRAVSAAGGTLVVRGAGTGLAGGATAGAGQVVLCLRHWQEILEVSEENLTARVQPGILNGELNAALAQRGLWWPPDPASKDISTVGGNIATNAGGLLCAKYGVTRESVLALEVVLADGTLLRVGHSTVKGVSGYDVTALMVGSEGTLGIITEATLKLRPARSAAQVTCAAVFMDVDAAVRAAQAITAARLRPAVMELMDEPTVEYLTRYLGTDPTGGGGSLLLVQTDGAGAVPEAEAVAELLRPLARTLTVAATPEEGEELMAFRRACFPAFEAAGSTLVEDIAVPRSRMAEAFARIREIEARHGVEIPTAAHAGDGNLHPIFVFQAAGQDGEVQVPPVIWEAASEVFQVALELGGTLTGEHGVGLLKRRWLGAELGDAQYALQSRLRDAFDPARVLNPGKVL